MIALSALTPRVVLQALGLPQPTAEMFLLDAAIEFCHRADAIRRTVSVSMTNATQATIPSTTSEEPIDVLEVYLDGARLTPISEREAFTFDATQVYAPKHYTREGAVLTLYPTYPTSGVLRVLASFAPKRDATEVNDLFASDWLDALVHGALARAHDMPGQPFTNPAMAQFCRVRFSQGFTAAGIYADRANVEAPMRITVNNF